MPNTRDQSLVSRFAAVPPETQERLLRLADILAEIPEELREFTHLLMGHLNQLHDPGGVRNRNIPTKSLIREVALAVCAPPADSLAVQESAQTSAEFVRAGGGR